MNSPALTDPVPHPNFREPTQKLFVYGTLRRGSYNNRLLSDSRFISEEWLYGHVKYGPLMVQKGKPEDRVRGEVWEVPTLTLLGPVDNLEGHPYAWCRTWVPDQHNGIWVYLYSYPGSSSYYYYPDLL